MINTPAPWKLLHTWIMWVIVRQHLQNNGRIDGPGQCLSSILAAVRSQLPTQTPNQVVSKEGTSCTRLPSSQAWRESNLLVRIDFIIVMIRWTGLAPALEPGMNADCLCQSQPIVMNVDCFSQKLTDTHESGFVLRDSTDESGLFLSNFRDCLQSRVPLSQTCKSISFRNAYRL